MIKKTRITIKDKSITITELSVRQVWDLIAADLGVHEDIAGLELSVGLSAAAIERRFPAAGDLDQLWSAFKQVNAALLEPAVPEKTMRPNAQKSKKPDNFKKILDAALCRLVMAGHARVWDYGFSFFLTALKQYEKHRSGHIRDMAIAMFNATRGKGSDFQKYLKELK